MILRLSVTTKTVMVFCRWERHTHLVDLFQFTDLCPNPWHLVVKVCPSPLGIHHQSRTLLSAYLSVCQSAYLGTYRASEYWI